MPINKEGGFNSQERLGTKGRPSQLVHQRFTCHLMTPASSGYIAVSEIDMSQPPAIRYNLRSRQHSAWPSTPSPTSEGQKPVGASTDQASEPSRTPTTSSSSVISSPLSSQSGSHESSSSSSDDYGGVPSVSELGTGEVLSTGVQSPYYRRLWGVNCEDPGKYRPEGFCPVVVGISMNSRYEVVHKLGWGSFCTVWLARDHHKGRYVAVKVTSAKDTQFDGYVEVTAHLALQKRLAEQDRVRHIVPLLDWFGVASGNGRHLCLVFEFNGPSLAYFTDEQCKRSRKLKVRPDHARKLARDAAEGLQKLHNVDIIVGDISAANMVFKVSDEIHDWPIETLYERLGPPRRVPLVACQGWEFFAEKHAPDFVYEAIDWTKDRRWQFLEPALRYIDLAYVSIDGKKTNAHTTTYSDSGPDFGQTEDPLFPWLRTRESDVFALACIWYELRTGEVLQSVSLQNRWALYGGRPVWKERKLQRLNDVAASRALAGRLRFTIIRQLLRTISATFTELLLGGPCPQEVCERFGRRYLRCTCGDCGELRRRYWFRGTLQSARKDDRSEFRNKHRRISLKRRLYNIGRDWTRWHALTVAQRRAALNRLRDALDFRRRYNGQALPQTDEELDTGAPPPVKLSTREARDFEEVLLMMLTDKRRDRATLQEILDMPWCDLENQVYPFENGNQVEKRDQEEPWCQAYSAGPEDAKTGFMFEGKRYM
ncbi:Serine/threonine-protein kinase spk-1 [Cyphellophora attinorum]|uniref:non-specific serine/threonine protein kinase n=1 Tax=Cyphellophora attinorum TaxID=1664694 RepID=A0A0N1HXB5_9EURO|nr:Serine/threonine-protein kinase spk-1 [Phialophora attinorum]KPI42574.1 Serine/threonine-protein kinase spk-1 [Phialophora attinorum]